MADQDGVANGGLQFDRADFGDQAAKPLTCANCASPIGSAYFEARGQVICEACRHRLEEFLATRPGLPGFLKALGAGLGAALAGCVIYYAVLALSGYEFGLIAILVGYMVGRAVRWGSGNRGGAAFQALAIALTYITIVSSYVPIIITQVRAAAAKEAVHQAGPTSATGSQVGASASPATNETDSSSSTARPTFGGFLRGLALVSLFVLALPFLQGASNIIGLLIIGFALYEAWKINRRVEVVINGPFTPAAA